LSVAIARFTRIPARFGFVWFFHTVFFRSATGNGRAGPQKRRSRQRRRGTDRSYCKATFGLNYPFLKEIMPDAPSCMQRADENGYDRFWRDPLEIDGAQFLVCSQWFAWQRPAFDRWVGGVA
jgi:hypothetical protein